MKQEENSCCPHFSTEKWSEKEFNWDKKKFIKARVPTFFHIPLVPMLGNRITKLMQLAESSKKLDENREDILLLFTDPNAFMSNLYLSVTGDIPEAKNTTLSGTFVTKVFDGPYKKIPKFMKQMDHFLKGLNEEAKRYFVHYAYCPKCAKKAGHNYMILFAELAH